MNTQTLIKPHWSFWVISVLALIWNAMGCMNFFMQMDPEFVATLPDSYQTSVLGRPTWATGAFAVAVFGAVIGCILILLRKSIALYALIFSLIGMLVTIVYTILVVSFNDGGNSVLISTSISLIVAIFLVSYCRFATRQNWMV